MDKKDNVLAPGQSASVSFPSNAFFGDASNLSLFSMGRNNPSF